MTCKTNQKKKEGNQIQPNQDAIAPETLKSPNM